MATYTTNLSLKKPAQSDKIRIADINNNMDMVDQAIGDLTTNVGKCEVRVVDMGTISSLPASKAVTGLETDEVCIAAYLGTPSAQRSSWTVSTDTAGTVTVSGTISGSTTLKLYLMKSR